jgi:hypothetical protein
MTRGRWASVISRLVSRRAPYWGLRVALAPGRLPQPGCRLVIASRSCRHCQRRATRRTTDDDRAVLLRLTPDGEALLAKVMPAHIALVRELFIDRIDPDHLATVRDALARVAGDEHHERTALDPLPAKKAAEGDRRPHRLAA